jgi:hypothetical protein
MRRALGEREARRKNRGGSPTRAALHGRCPIAASCSAKRERWGDGFCACEGEKAAPSFPLVMHICKVHEWFKGQCTLIFGAKSRQKRHIDPIPVCESVLKPKESRHQHIKKPAKRGPLNGGKSQKSHRLRNLNNFDTGFFPRHRQEKFAFRATDFCCLSGPSFLRG